MGGFVIRRFGRLFPLLVLATVLYVLASNSFLLIKIQLIEYGQAGILVHSDSLSYQWPTVLGVLTTLTFTHALGMHDSLILNYVGWSVSVEFWTYILFELLVRTVPKRFHLAVFSAVLSVAFLVTLWASAIYHQCLTIGKCLDLTYDFSFARYVFSFLLGVFILNFREKGRRFEGEVQIVLLIVLLILFGLVTRIKSLAFIFPFVFALLIWSLSKDSGFAVRLLSGRVGKILGERSFSIYMLHPVLLALGFGPVASRMQSSLLAPVFIAVYLGVLLFLSRLTYRWFEVPLRRFFNTIADRYDGKTHPLGPINPSPSSPKVA